jgi:hypothetical protein
MEGADGGTIMVGGGTCRIGGGMRRISRVGGGANGGASRADHEPRIVGGDGGDLDGERGAGGRVGGGEGGRGGGSNICPPRKNGISD